MKLRILIKALVVLVALSVPACAFEQDATEMQKSFLELKANPLNANDLSGEYSFLQEFYQDNKNKKIQTFDFSDSQNDSFLIVHVQSPLDCGAHGCATLIYKKLEDKSFKKLSNYIAANEPFYTKMCNNNSFLIFAPGAGMDPGYSEWKFNGEKFQFEKKYLSLDDASVCN